MEKKIKIPTVSVIGITILLLGVCHASTAETKTYIIHMAKSEMPARFELDHSQWYESSLKSVSDSAEMIYTYNNVIHGFSTILTLQEVRKMEVLPGILSVLPELRYELHTTRTPSFLGLDQNAAMFPESYSASDVIVGVLDTGVWPESLSFNDRGFGPIPISWKGECEIGIRFTKTNCNKKLVGARYFARGYEATHGSINKTLESKSPRDDVGHGTHTSTTAVGSFVTGANLFGYANGTARGMAPGARLAAYKVCWLRGCLGSDILAAMEKAIDDNVTVLSLSLGSGTYDYYMDSVAIAAFAAMERGIFVSCSAGNAGPSAHSLSNVAPWITTVGAGTLDRDFPAYLILGNGKNYSGVSLYKGVLLPVQLLPFVYAGNVSNATGGNFCLTGTLIAEKVKGKIVLCDRGLNPRVLKGAVVKAAGGVGMVLANTAVDGEEFLADAHFLPTTAVGLMTARAIKDYLSSDSNSTATIFFQGTKLGIEPSPMVASFSSRGPSSVTPQILKPDIIAPGVNILAGWSRSVGPSSLVEDRRRVSFNIISGTSMACPHVSGLAALLKASHAHWSPAAIRSALMTTAYTAYKNGKVIEDISTGKQSTPFDYGAGHVSAVSAFDPGLIYDLDAEDYLNLLCALNYVPAQIYIIAGKNFNCSMGNNSVNDLNYPSFAVSLGRHELGSTSSRGSGGSSTVVKYTRTVTNVGTSGLYKVSMSTSSDSVNISVDPTTLNFSHMNEKKSYTVTFSATTSMLSDTNEFGRIEWSDGKHVVGSQVAFSWS